MPVNTRQQTAGLSPLIKVSKKRKQFQNRYQLRNPFQYQNQQITHEVNQSQEELSIGEQSILLDVL
jgi:hypothetical protein